MSTCDQIEVEACPVHDTVTDNAPGCDEPNTVQAESVDVAEVVEQLLLTEEQKDELQVLEEVPEDVCDTGDVGGNSHQGTSEEQESLAAEVVPGEDLELSCKVVEQDASAATESETKSTEYSGDVIPVEIFSENHAQGEEQPSKVDEPVEEIPTPQQQRKLARLAHREGKEKEPAARKDVQSIIAESAIVSSTVLNEASANRTHETQDTPPVASSSEGETANKPGKLNSKQRRARNKRLEAEKAGASVTADTVEKTVNSLSAPVAASPVTVATMGTEEATQKRKKLTSSERRARKLAQAAEKSTQVVPAPSANTEAPTPMPASTQQDTEPIEAVTKTKKLSGKQKKAKKRAAEAAQAAATLAGLADAEPVAGATTKAPAVADSIPGVAAIAPHDSANSAPLRKKLTSTERRAKRDAKLAAAEAVPAVIEPPVSALVTTVPSTADKVASTKEVTEASPKAKKLSSKQRKAARRARELTEAEASAATEVAQASVPKPVAPVPVPAEKNASKERASNKKVPYAPVTHPSITAALTPDQSIALHASLATVRQGLLSRDSVIYTQQGAMKMHLLTELCKLGYSCIEGSASSFQQITWCPTNQCLTYTTAIVNAPHQYPATLRAKGELKIATPGLSVQLKCYPTFGAGSPDLMGRKNFRSGFVRHFEEVTARETDSFVFVLPIGVYNQYAREAVRSLPVAQTIQQHLSRHVVVYVNKTQEEIRLNGVFCSVDTLYGEFIVGSVLLA